MPERLEALKHWLETELSFREYTLTPASEDASFRRYFRVAHGAASYIVMDAPPDREDSRPFITVSKLFADAGLQPGSKVGLLLYNCSEYYEAFLAALKMRMVPFNVN